MIFIQLITATFLYILLLLLGCSATAMLGSLASDDTAILWLPLFQVVMLSTLGIAGYVFGRLLQWGGIILGIPVAIAALSLFESIIGPLLGLSLSESLLPYGLGTAPVTEGAAWLRMREWLVVLLMIITLCLALWGGLHSRRSTSHYNRQPNKHSAIVGSLIAPGLGFIYLGRLRWALFNVLILALPLLLLFSRSAEDAVASSTVYDDSALIYTITMLFSVIGTMTAQARSTIGDVIYQNVGGYCCYVVGYILVIMVGANLSSNVTDYHTHVVSSDGGLPVLNKREQVFVDEELTVVRGHLVVVAMNDTDRLYRVIGLPGETINYESGTLQVNQQKAIHKTMVSHVVVDEYAKEETLLGVSYHVKLQPKQTRVESFKLTLRSDEYWLMNDNRNVSDDSRLHGAFIAGDIKGVAANIVYSPYHSQRTGLSLLPK